MLKTCSICGTIHDFDKVCKRPRKEKKNTESNRFRKTNKWTEMSKSIRRRDNYLCRVCLSGKYKTNYRYTYKELEVHHIIPIEKDYSKRLDSRNLITLCRMHHEMAESGQIPIEELQSMVMEAE